MTACVAGLAVAAAEGNSDDAGSSGEPVERRTGSEVRSPPAGVGHTPQTHPAEGNACCTPQRTAGKVSGAHCLQT